MTYEFNPVTYEFIHPAKCMNSYVSDPCLVYKQNGHSQRRWGGGWGNAATIASHFGPGLKSQPGCKSFFANFCTNSYKNCYTNCILRIRTRCGFCINSYIFFFVRIHTKIVIQIVYYEFVHGVVFVPIHTFFYTNCIVRIHTTSRTYQFVCYNSTFYTTGFFA